MKTMDALTEGGERFELEPGDEGYPSCIQDGYERLPHLYGVGDPSVLATPCLGVIGARKATPYGIEVARMAGEVAAACGITVVSGGARGCDAAASAGALQAGGRTIIVSGCGADGVYPRSSAEIFRKAPQQGGCILALESWGTPPRRYAFPKRNRLIAALSQALLVTEAGRRSGTMITAEAAMDIGRNVYAVPGSIFSPTSEGTNYLIANGAALITDEVGLMVQISLDFGVSCTIAERPHPELCRVLSALVASPQRPDGLAGKIGVDAAAAERTLSTLWERGLVVRLPDGRMAASEKAYELLRGKG